MEQGKPEAAGLRHQETARDGDQRRVTGFGDHKGVLGGAGDAQLCVHDLTESSRRLCGSWVPLRERQRESIK